MKEPPALSGLADQTYAPIASYPSSYISTLNKIIMKVQTMNDLLIAMLKDVYSAETQLIMALPKMADKASSQSLKTAFSMHLKQTEKQKERLEKIAGLMNIKLTGETCEAMQGNIQEAEELMSEITDNKVLDAALIVAGQKVEHYEIATYGALATFARDLKLKDVEKLLQETLAEEKETDRKLTEIAESRVNVMAEQNSR